jgi:hypothetical protein
MLILFVVFLNAEIGVCFLLYHNWFLKGFCLLCAFVGFKLLKLCRNWDHASGKGSSVVYVLHKQSVLTLSFLVSFLLKSY